MDNRVQDEAEGIVESLYQSLESNELLFLAALLKSTDQECICGEVSASGIESREEVSATVAAALRGGATVIGAVGFGLDRKELKPIWYRRLSPEHERNPEMAAWFEEATEHYAGELVRRVDDLFEAVATPEDRAIDQAIREGQVSEEEAIQYYVARKQRSTPQ